MAERDGDKEKVGECKRECERGYYTGPPAEKRNNNRGFILFERLGGLRQGPIMTGNAYEAAGGPPLLTLTILAPQKGGLCISRPLNVLTISVESKPDRDEFRFSLSLELPGILFTVLVRCPHAALDLTGDTLLDYEVRGYSTVVLFGSNLCRLAPADGC